MLLRESGKKDDQQFDLSVVVGNDTNLGLEFESEILALTDAVCRGQPEELAKVRAQTEAAMGAQKTVDVIMVAAGFSGITKIANGTGLHLDPDTESTTIEMRHETGIENYSEAAKSERFG